MPTAARLVAAVLYGALAWYASELIKPLFPENADLGLFSEFNACVGVVVGWQVAGSRAGDGWRAAVGYGLTATAGLVFWALFLQSSGEMIRKSLRKQYDGPVDAVIGIFQLMIEHGQIMADGAVVATLVLGGILAGLVVEWSSRRWS